MNTKKQEADYHNPLLFLYEEYSLMLVFFYIIVLCR